VRGRRRARGGSAAVRPGRLRRRPGARGMTAERDERDTRFMRRALELAARGRGLTSPNPMVGAVIVSGETIVGEGFHERAGGPHAEVVALAASGARSRGA